MSDEELIRAGRRQVSRTGWMHRDRKTYRRALLRPDVFTLATAHMGPRKNNLDHQVYVYAFSDGTYYAGVTRDSDRRHRGHGGHGEKGPVFDHARKTGLRPRLHVLCEPVSRQVAGDLEVAVIGWLRGQGHQVLNKSRGGQLGRARESGPRRYESVLRQARQRGCLTIRQLRQRCPAGYRRAREMGWTKRLRRDLGG